MPQLEVREHLAKGHGQVTPGPQRRDSGLSTTWKHWQPKCFVRDRKSITVLFRMDNTTGVAYVNKLGGTVSLRLNTIVRNLWLWCMNRDITLATKLKWWLPGVLNTIADQKS